MIILNQKIIQWEEGPLSDFDANERRMIEFARKVSANAWAPYSNFYVGCATQLTSGEILTGANNENAASGNTICAERNALGTVNSQNKTKHLHMIAVTGRLMHPKKMFPNEISKNTLPVTPCGACLQSLKEAEDRTGGKLIFLLDGFNDEIVWKFKGVDSLMPFGFGPKSMGIKM